MLSCFNKFASLLILLSLWLIFNASAENYVKLNQFNTENGLNQNTILGMMQDNEGYLWIATSEGVNRFDGYRMSSLSSPGNILSANPIQLIWQDSTGLIWIGADPDNNYVLDRQNEQLTPIILSAPNDYSLEFAVFDRMVEDQNRDLWISTFREIYFFNRSKNKYEFILSVSELFDDPKKQHFIRDLLIVDEFLIIATSNGLYSLNQKTNRINLLIHINSDLATEDQNNVKKLHLSKNNQLLVGTVEGLYSIDPKYLGEADKKHFAKLIIADLNIWQIIEKQDFFWVATDKGLYKLWDDYQLNFIFKFSDTAFNTSDDDIVSMIEDREGSLWFGSHSDGIFKWHPNAAIKKHLWKKGAQDSRLSDDMVHDIVQTEKDIIWIATKNGLTRYNQKTDKTTSYLVDSDEKQVLSGSTIYSIASNKGKLWLNTFDGIQVFNSQTLKKESIIFPAVDEKIFDGDAVQIYFLTQDNLAIITRKGIYDYSLSNNSVSLIESTKPRGGKPLEYIAFFDTATGKSDEYFVSAVDQLLVYSRDSNLLTTFHQLPGDISHNTSVAGLFREGDKLWLTYPGYGLFVLDANSGKEIHFLSETSIGANSMMDIFPDEKGNMWVISNEGLLRINQLNYHVAKFDSNDGFVTSEFNYDTSLQLDNGEVYLGSVKGAFRFDPNEIDNQSGMPVELHINKVSLLSKELSSQYSNFNNSQVELDYDDFGLKIEFSALLLNKPKQVKYQYWIEGDNSIEKTTIEGGELFFPSFESGKSQLYISATGYNHAEQSIPVKLTIISHAAPWFSIWAITLYLLTLTLMISLGWSRYQKVAAAKESSHQRIKKSEERLSLALKGGNSGLWDWHAIDNMVYEPRLVNSEEQQDEKLVSFKERLAAIHFRDQNKVLSQWRHFLRGKSEVFDVIYRMKQSDQQWLWYRDIAMVSEYDKEQVPIRVTGTYTNITEKQEATEQVGLYSKAFENTRDIILILNSDKKIIAFNKAFQTTSCYQSENVLDSGLEYFVTSPGNNELLTEIFREIEHKNHWEGEAEIIKEDNDKIPVLINATTFLGNDSNRYFVFSMSDISKQKGAEQKLKKLVNYDALSGLPNRTLLLEHIRHAIKQCKRYEKQLAVFFVDLDRFKQINDTLGHDIGDLLLIKAGNILTSTIREDDIVARIGGDEFVVMLEDIANVTSISRVAQDILRKMEKPVSLKNHQVTISASIGISIYPQDAVDAATLLKHADIAMYHAKSEGRNNFQYFEDYMNRAAKHRLDIENKLRHAVTHNEFYLQYQPQFDIVTGQLSGIEALARWKTAAGEIIPPSKFIPVAEELGLIIPMTERLLLCAMDNIQKWNSSSNKITLAFNLSTCHIYDPGFLIFMENLAREYSSSIHLLEFELTESILMEDIAKASGIFKRLDSMGVDLALDDFGTGYSSLKYLSQLPIDKLKIDMSFVSKIGTSSENDAIVRTIISLAESLNLKIVAEGIETFEQYGFLKLANVNYAQGFLFSRPLDAVDLEKFFTKEMDIIVHKND